MEPESRKGAREFQVDDDMAGEVAVLRTTTRSKAQRNGRTSPPRRSWGGESVSAAICVAVEIKKTSPVIIGHKNRLSLIVFFADVGVLIGLCIFDVAWIEQ